MLTIARGLMTRPKLMMLDEPSQGLAPKLADEVFVAISPFPRQGKETLNIEDQVATFGLGVLD